MKKILFALKILRAFSDASQKFVSDVQEIMANEASSITGNSAAPTNSPDNNQNEN